MCLIPQGVGRRYAHVVLRKADIDLNKRAGELTEEEVSLCSCYSLQALAGSVSSIGMTDKSWTFGEERPSVSRLSVWWPSCRILASTKSQTGSSTDRRMSKMENTARWVTYMTPHNPKKKMRRQERLIIQPLFLWKASKSDLECPQSLGFKPPFLCNLRLVCLCSLELSWWRAT